jgi:hypothetical protein
MEWVKGRAAVVVAMAVAVVLGLSAVLAACAGAESGRGSASGADGRAAASSSAPAGTGSTGAPSSSTPPAAPPGSTAPPVPSGTELPGDAVGVDFASDGSGFALLAECSKTRCVQRVAVLEKGAGAWRPATSPLPDVTGDLGITAGLTVLGPGRALITEGTWPPPDRTWFTSDGGNSWRQSTNKPEGTTPTVPEGGVLILDCTRSVEDGNGCEGSRLLAVMPATGEYRILAHQPPFKGLVSPAGQTDGRLYASGLDPRSGRPAIAVSEDRGNSWRTAPLPGAALEGGGSLSVVSDGSALYVSQSGQLPDEDDVKNGLLTLHRSTDDGRTWQRVWRHRKGVEPRSLLGVPIAAADGSLTIHGEDGVWRSTDQGRSFTRAGDSRGPTGWVATTSLGYLYGDALGAGRYCISADGVRWTTFDMGDGP